jgi:1,4-alpha-glucan branching enzyme
VLVEWLTAYEDRAGEEGVVVACYDTELCGHWWFEGPAWLDRVFELLAEHPRVRPLSLEKALERLPPQGAVDLVEGSWGFRKDLRSWIGPETEEMWRLLAETEAETVRLARKWKAPGGAQEAALAQLARELLLMQSSDWPFMILQGRNAQYARERFDGHRDRWQRLADALLGKMPEAPLERLAAELYDVDNVFPDLRARELA